MATYWVTEALPLYVTGLIPVFAFPALDIMVSAIEHSILCPLNCKSSIIIILRACAAHQCGYHVLYERNCNDVHWRSHHIICCRVLQFTHENRTENYVLYWLQSKEVRLYRNFIENNCAYEI